MNYCSFIVKAERSFDSRVSVAGEPRPSAVQSEFTAGPEQIEYTPEEMQRNDVMMSMEFEALQQVEKEAIDRHSKALQ